MERMGRMALPMNILLPVLLVVLLPDAAQAAVQLPTIFKTGMVLQQEPLLANVYGTTDSQETIEVSLICQSGYITDDVAFIEGAEFSALVGPVPEGDVCSLVVSQGADEHILDDILFGDVWVCSGQSNMEFEMASIYNSSEEIAGSSGYTNIRMYDLAHMTSEVEEDELLAEADGWDRWADAADGDRLALFSAVCFLTARTTSDFIGGKTYGLIGSNWGGTRIEAWSPSEVIEDCDVPDNVDTEDPQNSNTYLYNAMINPLTKFTVKGVLWYQGEANAGYNRDLYPCSFSQMIQSWRLRWSQDSGSLPDFPFGFVQLASNQEDYDGYDFPVIRWHQTDDLGYVPNGAFENVFMAVALDTHDHENGIHPRDKQTVGYRLAVAGMNQAYDFSEYPVRGPRPVTADAAAIDNGDGSDGGVSVALGFADGAFTYNPVENSGFYVCQLDYDACDDTPGSWTLLESTTVSQSSSPSSSVTVLVPSSATGLAYLWNESPLLVPLAAPIYADDAFGLPAAPFKMPVVIGHTDVP